MAKTFSNDSGIYNFRGTGSLGTPIGTSAQRPQGDLIAPGHLRWNTTLNRLEVWSGVAWNPININPDDFVKVTGDAMSGDLDIQAPGRLTMHDGQQAAPSITFTNDTSVGFYQNSGNLRMTNAGLWRVQLTSQGTLQANPATNYETLISSPDDFVTRAYVDSEISDKTTDPNNVRRYHMFSGG